MLGILLGAASVVSALKITASIMAVLLILWGLLAYGLEQYGLEFAVKLFAMGYVLFWAAVVFAVLFLVVLGIGALF